MALVKVHAVQDDSGHWYVIPDDKKDEYTRRMNEMYEDGFQNYDLIQAFDNDFGKYQTGGDLNNTQLYAELDV